MSDAMIEAMARGVMRAEAGGSKTPGQMRAAARAMCVHHGLDAAELIAVADGHTEWPEDMILARDFKVAALLRSLAAMIAAAEATP